MKFEIDRDSIHSALQTVVRIVPHRSPIPILSNVLVTAEDDSIHLVTSDLDLSVITKITGDIKEPGKTTVPAAQFSELILRIGPGKLSFEEEGNRVSIVSESGRYTLMGIAPDDFPSVPTGLEGLRVGGMEEKLDRMIDKTIFAVSKDRTRMALNGVLWRIEPEKISMVATDGHRLARFGLTMTTGTTELCDRIIPPKALENVRRLLGPESVLNAITFGENHVLFDFGETYVVTRVIEGPYPNYEQVIPLSNERIMQVNSEVLLQAVQRVSVLSSASTHQIVMSLSENTLELSASNQEMGGEAKESMVVEYKSEPMEIGYNAIYLAEVLGKMEGEDVRFELDTPNTAGIVRPVTPGEGQEYIFLIMPLRIEEEE